MNSKKRTISILGSTGSIGVQTLQVIDNMPERFDIAYLTCNTRVDILEEQAIKYNPLGVVITDETAYATFKNSTKYKGEILFGEDAICSAASYEKNDIVLSALVGFSGVMPTIAALEKGIDVALANKETLVSAGSIVSKIARENKARIIAVDSEHSAILQCLEGEAINSVEKIILTASGGPFRNRSIEEFENISIEDALNHPNWAMGSKITIDSATMMNKGLEVIEAYWLFGIDIENIEILVHPQSIIHSMVQFKDGSVKAQLGLPDMRIPIAYSLTYPLHEKFDFPRLDLTEIAKLEFFKPDFEKFKCLKLAFDAIKLGGTAPAVLNAANEVAVNLFLNKQIKFNDIAKLIEMSLESMPVLDSPSLNDIIEADYITRRMTKNFINYL